MNENPFQLFIKLIRSSIDEQRRIKSSPLPARDRSRPLPDTLLRKLNSTNYATFRSKSVAAMRAATLHARPLLVALVSFALHMHQRFQQFSLRQKCYSVGAVVLVVCLFFILIKDSDRRDFAVASAAQQPPVKAQSSFYPAPDNKEDVYCNFSGDQHPDPSVNFSTLNWDEVDYSKGPQGQSVIMHVRKREKPEGKEATYTVYQGKDGRWYLHGKQYMFMPDVVVGENNDISWIDVQHGEFNFVYGTRHGTQTMYSFDRSSRVTKRGKPCMQEMFTQGELVSEVFYNEDGSVDTAKSHDGYAAEPPSRKARNLTSRQSVLKILVEHGANSPNGVNHMFSSGEDYDKTVIVFSASVAKWAQIVGSEPEILSDGYDSFTRSTYKRWRWRCTDGNITFHGDVLPLHTGTELRSMTACFY